MTSYGFVIDNRKCIGCHACTVACKAEHDVPLGVFRTWVKYIEKGSFPNTRRLFSVLRCNHCENAPCVEICPVTALYIRGDKIVDFDGSRCIGCKSCMQACPYDALYIDPQTQTAAKCNYCSNRVEIGLEPACVVVCPEQAIIAGDVENPNSKISQIIAKQTVTVRKPEKGTVPKVFYIDGDSAMLTPLATSSATNYMWSSQGTGVGHFAGHQVQLEVLTKPTNGSSGNIRVYDAPNKARLWGKEVPSYLLSKGIAAGMGLLMSLLLLNDVTLGDEFLGVTIALSLLLMGATAWFLITDLDQPRRFYTILLRPQFKSWLTRGAVIISLYATVLMITGLLILISSSIPDFLLILMAVSSILTAIYTAFLFAQAKGRDFWQSPLLPLEMLTHSILAGSAVMLILSLIGISIQDATVDDLRITFIVTGMGTAIFAVIELVIPHMTEDAKLVAHSFRSGKWALSYWSGIVLTGIVCYGTLFGHDIIHWIATIAALVGLFFLNRATVYAPQEVSLI
jgi:Fe-S-cluster-containing dehydrogenase component/formate-dependent nitrite reductase membrane component NrfD